jgi:RimJ/RimL family protein N-acetyltransferase
MTALLAFLLQQSAADGFKMAFYIIDSRNHPIRKVALKLGFQIDGEIRYRRYFTYVKKDMKALLLCCKLK